MSRLNEPIEVMLDRPRVMVCNMNAAAEIQKTTGINILTIGSGNGTRSSQDIVADLFSPNHLRQFIRACLLKDDPSVTIEQIGDWIDDAGKLSAAVKALTRTLGRFMGAKDADIDALEGVGTLTAQATNGPFVNPQD